MSYTDGKPMVKVVDAKGLVKKKPIELAEQRDNDFVVKSGLEPGDKLIIRTNRALKEGEAVQIQSGKN